jgi:hypothetical protein
MTLRRKTARRSKKSKPSKSYWWFQGASVKQLYDQIEQYGADNARLEVHVDDEKMTFRVISATGQELPGVNDSHRCPPDCG